MFVVPDGPLHLVNLADPLVEVGRVEDARRAWHEGVAILESVGLGELIPERRKELEATCRRAGVEPFG